MLGLLTALLQVACDDNQVVQRLRSLDRSGTAAVVCRDSRSGEGYPIGLCPDTVDGDDIELHTLALVTQMARGEIAVVDLTDNEVLDSDSTIPGPTFLQVGGNPVDVVTTPGGTASFVAVAETGREGIFGLATQCLVRAEAAEPLDLTSWPACSLPAAPGRLAVVVQHAAGEGESLARCDGGSSASAPAEQHACVADLAPDATAAGGRPLLVVTLPALGALAVLDPQQILDRAPGTFEACPVESWLDLSTELPAEGIRQTVPPGMVPRSACEVADVLEYPLPQQSFVPRPAGLDQGASELYVADRGAPVVHVVDVSDPCRPAEREPLLPLSHEQPERVVTTLDVALSPATVDDQRFVYAVDALDGSVMVFDVGEGGGDRTPRLSPTAGFRPTEAADRISFASPVHDFVFVERDVPVADPETGVGLVETRCDPDPDASGLATLYRSSSDYTRGARPIKMRGIFGAALLANGEVAFVDVEDWDAACRRPAIGNTSAFEDARGCTSDPIAEYRESDGSATVTNEASCRVVSPHQPRSARLIAVNDELGVKAPSLRSLPRLFDEDGALQTGIDDDQQVHPMMLAVPFPPDAASGRAAVHVGRKLYATDGSGDERFSTDRSLAQRNSVLLPMADPRAYFGSEEFAATYEGAIAARGRVASLNPAEGLLEDERGALCGAGVQDRAATEAWGAELGVSPTGLARFASSHGDYVSFSGELDESDPYWETESARSCADGEGFDGCLALFGDREDPTALRDWRIEEAYDASLVLHRPGRAADPADEERWLAAVDCCFAGKSPYEIRGGRQWLVTGSIRGFVHPMEAGEDGRCIRSCDPQRGAFGGRVLEASTRCDPAEGACPIGPSTTQDVQCVLPADATSVDPESESEGCVYASSTARFAVYRGAESSDRNMRFEWEVTGGFAPLRTSIRTTQNAISLLPQSILHLAASDRLLVVDAALGGVSVLSLSSLRLSPRTPFQ